MTQRQGQGYGGGALADPRDQRFALAAWDTPRFGKGDRIMVGIGEQMSELLIDATGYDDARHVPLYVTVNVAGVHQYADQAFIDEHAELIE